MADADSPSGAQWQDKRQHSTFWLEIRTDFFSMKVVKHWHRGPERL